MNECVAGMMLEKASSGAGNTPTGKYTPIRGWNTYTAAQLTASACGPLPETISPGLQRIMRRAMAWDPAARHGSANELLDDLALVSDPGCARGFAPVPLRGIAGYAELRAPGLHFLPP